MDRGFAGFNLASALNLASVIWRQRSSCKAVVVTASGVSKHFSWRGASNSWHRVEGQENK